MWNWQLRANGQFRGSRGTGGRAVASDVNDQPFQSSRWTLLFKQALCTVDCIQQSKLKKKRPEICHSKVPNNDR